MLLWEEQALSSSNRQIRLICYFNFDLFIFNDFEQICKEAIAHFQQATSSPALQVPKIIDRAKSMLMQRQQPIVAVFLK